MKLYKICEQKMYYLNYSENTIKTYLFYIDEFLRSTNVHYTRLNSLKHKALLVFTFSCGLRISEAINMKINDIDSERMLVLIRQSKGRKDRYSPLSEYTLKLLREYYKKYKPKEYLFNGQDSEKYSYTSCNNIFKKYVDNNLSTHTLRHSAATAALDNGTDLRYIQEWLGHKSSKTTEIYTHISVNKLHSIKQAI